MTIPVPAKTKMAWRLLKDLEPGERAFVLAWFCSCGCGRYVGPGESFCPEEGSR